MAACRSQTYDMILLNDIWLGYGILPLLKTQSRLMAIIAFMHDDSTLNHSTSATMSGRNLGFRFRAALEKPVIRNLDAVLTNSDYMRVRLRAVYPDTPAHQLNLTGMNYREVDFRPGQINPIRTVRILFIKNDFERGGLRVLIQALRSLHAHHFNLTIVGPTLHRLQRKLGDLMDSTERLFIDSSGPVTDQKFISSLYYGHDIVCVPSQQEGLGLVNAEALVHGTAVVSTNVGGIPEVLDHGNCGFLVPHSDPRELAKAILQCISEPETTARKIQHGRTFVLDRFDLDRMFTTLDNILLDVLTARRTDKKPVTSI
jgi:glycosyltransferase involved in cell wall biosynthesis